MPTCAMGSVAVRRVLAPLPGSGMRRGGRQLCRHFDFFHPLGNKAGICPPPPALPSCPSHGDGSGGGTTKLGNAPFLGGEGRGRGWCAWMHTCCTPSPGCTITPAQGSTWDAHTRAELTPVPAPGPAAAQRYPERSGAERGLRCPPQPWGLVPGGSGGPLPSPRRAGASGAAWSCPGGLDTPFSFKLMAVP